MYYLLTAVAAFFAGWVALTLALIARRGRSSQIVGARLPVCDAAIDLAKRFDISIGQGHGGTPGEKFLNVRILGYLSSDRDETAGEYIDSRWLVVEFADGRRAFLRPRYVQWLQEANAA